MCFFASFETIVLFSFTNMAYYSEGFVCQITLCSFLYVTVIGLLVFMEDFCILIHNGLVCGFVFL